MKKVHHQITFAQNKRDRRLKMPLFGQALVTAVGVPLVYLNVQQIWDCRIRDALSRGLAVNGSI